MHERIRQIIDVLAVAGMGESTKPFPVKIHRQRSIRGHENIDAQVKLLSTDQKWVHDVPLHDVRLGSWGLGLPPQFVFPLRDLLKLVEQEDASSLRLANGFHNPNALVLLELLHKQTVVSRQVEGGREEVVTCRLGLFVLSLESLLVSLKVLNH